MKRLLIVLLTFSVVSITYSQDLNFNKVMSYFISHDEEYIKKDLRARKFIIEKEKPAGTKFFDTEIVGLKSTDGEYTGVTAVVIFKIGGDMQAVGYMTFKKSDYNKRLGEVRNRGFELGIEDTSQYYIFRKGDTLVTGEKRILNISGRQYVRYEVCVTVQSFQDEGQRSLLLFNRKRYYQ